MRLMLSPDIQSLCKMYRKRDMDIALLDRDRRANKEGYGHQHIKSLERSQNEKIITLQRLPIQVQPMLCEKGKENHHDKSLNRDCRCLKD